MQLLKFFIFSAFFDVLSVFLGFESNCFNFYTLHFIFENIKQKLIILCHNETQLQAMIYASTDDALAFGKISSGGPRNLQAA